ncbi:energy transducer TonB [Sphingobacterium detergens]|uniref:TonB-like protein n=1 Tax=Sphingobacterium detergens TaxID=1145106 RepID=A0A420AFI3_SPHD1|nr:energy transducer TonB [Sphingobacterium detergens]RKE43257.1 TonB-like protein [Sphingobacterium detergens]
MYSPKFKITVSTVLLFIVCLTSRAQTAAVRNIPADSIAQKVDDFPYFKGGVVAWSRFLQNNLDLTRTVGAMDSVAYAKYGSKQTAILNFIVCEDGAICNIEIENREKVSPEFAKAVLAAMRKSPQWMPALVKGKPVKTKFRQPVVAVIE